MADSNSRSNSTEKESIPTAYSTSSSEVAPSTSETSQPLSTSTSQQAVADHTNSSNYHSAASDANGDHEEVAEDEEDDQEEGDSDDDEDGNYWCHACERTITPIMDTGTPTCSRCHSDFVEEIEDDNDHPRGHQPAAYDEEDPRSPADPAAASQELARVLQLFLQQMVGNNATISVQTRPPLQGETPNGVIITTPSTADRANEGGEGNEAASATAAAPAEGDVTSEPQPHQQHRGRTNRQRGTSAAVGENGGETISLTQLLQALFEGPTEGQPNPLAHILNMVGNPGDYVFGQRGLDDIITQLMEQHTAANAPPPANEGTIKSLPQVTLNQEQIDGQADCIICQDQFKVEDSAILLPCKHFFHTACVESWLKVNGTCPICRYVLASKESNSSTTPPPAASSTPTADELD